MIAMIFEFRLAADDPAVVQEYETVAAELGELVREVDGFEGIERFESVREPGKYVSIGFFRDERAVTAWRNTPQHRSVQAMARTRLLADYRLRMAEVVRDYGRDERALAPVDSRRLHG